MATTLTLLNKVLVGLRQPEISTGETSISDEYHKLLLQYLNDAKENAEESWDWQALRTTVTVTGVANQEDYELLSASEADTDVSEQARLLYGKTNAYGLVYESSINMHDNKPQVFDTTDANEFRLNEITPEEMERLRFTDDDQTDNRPYQFSLLRDEDNIRFSVYPKPAVARTWKLRFIIPQDELLDSDITTVLKIASRPIWQRALVDANAERGDELGQPGSIIDRKADESLAAAIARERTDEDDTSYPV